MPAKLKVACKQGGREQQVRSYTLPFPHAATQQLQATALGSVDPSASQSSAVHTLIPNLAPRSRLQHPGLMLRHQPQPLCNEGSADWETQRPGSACLPLQDHLLVDRSHEDAQAGEALSSSCLVLLTHAPIPPADCLLTLNFSQVLIYKCR